MILVTPFGQISEGSVEVAGEHVELEIPKKKKQKRVSGFRREWFDLFLVEKGYKTRCERGQTDPC